MDAYSSAINIVWLGLYVASIMVFLNWFRRAYCNLHRIDSTVPDHAEAATAYSWIVPFVNLCRPYQIMKQIWEKTQDFIENYDFFYYRRKGGVLLGIWVFLLVSSAILGRIYMELSDFSITDLTFTTKIAMLLDAETILEAGIVTYIVYMISKMETKLAEEVVKDRGMVIP